MPDLDLAGVADARTRLYEQRDELRKARLALAAASARLDRAASTGAGDEAAAAAVEVDRLHHEVVGLVAAARDQLEIIRGRAQDLLAAFREEDAVASLSGRHPILLLPVRLETRFFDGGATLKVRIFPDQVHVTAHDPAVTSDELDGLTWYWTHRWPDPDVATEPGRARAEQAWEGLSSRFRPGRAAFLVRTYPPVNLGSGEAAPHFGEVPLRAGEWSTAARAGLLPDRWCVLGYRHEGEGRWREIFRRWGGAVPDSLAAGPSPDLGPAGDRGGLPDDPDLRWLYDAAEAERLGMLITVRQDDVAAGANLADGVDRLIAVGVDWTLDPEQAAAAVDAHLAAHAHEGRLGFVPQGAPTNSTGTQRAAYSTDLAAARRVLAPHAAPAVLDGAAGPLTAAALGIAPATLAAVAGGDLREGAWQGALLDATWSATGGYYVSEMLDPVAEDPKIAASLRHHVTRHLRAAGPLPTLRIGNQPYGVLPVQPRDRFEPDLRRRAQADIQRVTAALRSLAEPLVASVPRLARVRQRDDVDDVLLALLQRTPVAWSLTFRKLVGPVERKAVGVDWDLLAAFQRDLTAMLLARLDCPALTLLSELTHDDRDHPLRVPLVLKPDPTPEEPRRQGTAYLAEIRSLLTEPNGADILDARKDSVALLEAFIACAAVIENGKAARQLLAGHAAALALSTEFAAYLNRSADRVPYTLRVESPPLPPVAPGSPLPIPTTPRELRQTVVPAVTGDNTLAQHVARELAKRVVLPGALDVVDDPLHELQRMEAALATLEQAPVDQLEWAFRGVLDLYATRLDAWITSLASARLAEHRAAAPSGVHVGGWGVVEELRPDTGPAAESLGYVHAPSLGQAASVAVLRSARATHRDDEGRLFDIDLTSRRVRLALRLLDGVGNGQRLAALLGYRIERGLQERDLTLAQWILPLRLQCPLRSERPDDPQVVEPVEVVAARDVVDGLALLERWSQERFGLLDAAGIPDGAARVGVAAVLDEVAGLSDAVSDVLVAEAVHQATSGNLERSGAALAAHDRQEPAPDPEFVRTPRTGAVLAHRVGVWLPRAAVAPAPGWTADVRSIAEPRLDRWLGAVLGPPSRWSVRPRLVRPSAGAPADEAPVVVELPTVSLDVLGLSALSLVLAARRPGAGQPSELETILAVHVAASPELRALGPTADDRLELDADDLAPLGDLSAWAAEVVAAAPLAPEHLTASTDLHAPAARGAATSVDADEAAARSDAVVTAVETALAALEQAAAAHAAAPDTVSEAALLGALGALVPVLGVDALATSGMPLADHALAVAERVRARLGAARAVTVPAVVVEPGDLPAPGIVEPPGVVAGRAAVRLLLGNGQPFLPVLTVDDPAPIAAALAARTDLLAGDDTAVVTWVHRSALVRPQLDPLAALLVHAELDGADVAGSLAVVQQPYAPGTRWVALPFGPSGPPPPGTVGLVLHAADGIDVAGGGAGVVVDSWTEAAPAREQTTAVTFHFDAPGARAPQAMLLAVHPALDPQRWDFDTLAGCVNEAMDLARLRTLGARELAPFTTLLPALFLPDTYTRDVPGVRLFELAENARFHGVGALVADHVLGKG